MPALDSAALLDAVVQRAADNGSSDSPDVLRVICAWPVSGQYGPGSRVLYYVLIAACVLARKSEWLKDACLAAALLFPAVAALHGICLAVYHADGAVDMDIYGAFQLCAMGILAAPVTVRMSRTYFYDPGRNTIFLWAGLLLAGLLSLTVEFYRASATPCPFQDDGTPISANPSSFPYGRANCSITCSVLEGPHSPMRGGSANNVYVIPEPDRLTFSAATLLAAGCCVQAILWLVSMWNKVLEINFKSHFRDGEAPVDEPVDVVDGATADGATADGAAANMNKINNMLRYFLSVAAIPVFGLAGLAILIVGELNFFSHQVKYEIEPMASIGQWAPIAGTGLAMVGSLYLLLAIDVEKLKSGDDEPDAAKPCSCPHHGHGSDPQFVMTGGEDDQSSDGVDLPSPTRPTDPPPMREIGIGFLPSPTRTTDFRRSGDLGRSQTHDVGRTVTHSTTDTSRRPRRSQTTTTTDVGNRRKVAEAMIAFGDYVGTAARDWFDDSEFKSGRAVDFPEIPGEELRNRALRQIRERYNQPRDADGNVTPMLQRSRSRTSFQSSVASGAGGDDDEGSVAGSPRPPRSRSASPMPSARMLSSPVLRRQHANTLPTEGGPFPPGSPGSPGLPLPRRRDTLEVPSPVRHGHMRTASASSVASMPSVTSAPSHTSAPLLSRGRSATPSRPDVTSHPRVSALGTPPARTASPELLAPPPEDLPPLSPPSPPEATAQRPPMR